MRTCGDNISNTDRYCKSVYDNKNVTLCSKCKKQIDGKKSYYKSIYDPEPIPQETRDLILRKVVEMNRFRV